MTVKRNLKVLISNEFKFSKNFPELAKQAKQTFGLIARNFAYKSRDNKISLYMLIVNSN